jgi:hypothetical protein
LSKKSSDVANCCDKLGSTSPFGLSIDFGQPGFRAQQPATFGKIATTAIALPNEDKAV